MGLGSWVETRQDQALESLEEETKADKLRALVSGFFPEGKSPIRFKTVLGDHSVELRCRLAPGVDLTPEMVKEMGHDLRLFFPGQPVEVVWRCDWEYFSVIIFEDEKYAPTSTTR